MLTFSDDIGGALRKACDHHSDRDALHLAQAEKGGTQGNVQPKVHI